MNKEQYEFSKLFYLDKEWDLSSGIPKYFTIDNEGNIQFFFLNEEEEREFIKILSRENDKIQKSMRKNKIKKIFG